MMSSNTQAPSLFTFYYPFKHLHLPLKLWNDSEALDIKPRFTEKIRKWKTSDAYVPFIKKISINIFQNPNKSSAFISLIKSMSYAHS